MSELQTIETAVSTDAKATGSWLLLHERLIITILIIFSVLFVGNKILDHEAAKDKVASDAAASALSVQQEANKTLAAQIATTQQQYQQLAVQLSQQNQQITQAMQTRTVVLHDQQTTDQTLPLPDLGNRWAELAKVQPTELTATTQGITATPDAARATVTQLEEVPVLTDNVTAEKTQNDNLTKELSSANNLDGLLTNQIAGLNTQVTDEEKACSTEETTLKADARKGKLRWFGIGYGTGFVSGLIVGHLK